MKDIWWRWLSFVSDNSLSLLNLSSSGWHLEWHYQFHHSLLVHELLHCWPTWHNFLTLQTSLLVDALLTKTKSCRLRIPGNFEYFNCFVLQSWTISNVTFTCEAITCFRSSVQNTLERLYDWVILEKMRWGENLVCPAIRKEIWINSNFLLTDRFQCPSHGVPILISSTGIAHEDVNTTYPFWYSCEM